LFVFSFFSIKRLKMERIDASVKQGYRVASGTSVEDPRFNEDGGTIRLQIPEFKKRGLDFDTYFGGKADEAYVCSTLGLDLAPRKVIIVKPQYFFPNVRWTNKFDAEIPGFCENFFLSKAEVAFQGKTYKALLYIPDPKTKPGHFHPATTIEVIAEKISGIRYGDRVTLGYNPQALTLAT
jgi:hypothetical protein